GRWFDDIGRRLENAADVIAHALVLGHVRLHDLGLRAALQRLEHRHRRANAEAAGDVAGRHNHAASTGVPDDQRLAGELRAVALFDRGVEGVAVDVGNAEPFEFGVGDEPPAPASPAHPVTDVSNPATAPAQGALVILRFVPRHAQRCHEPPLEARRRWLLSPAEVAGNLPFARAGLRGRSNLRGLQGLAANHADAARPWIARQNLTGCAP